MKKSTKFLQDTYNLGHTPEVEKACIRKEKTQITQINRSCMETVINTYFERFSDILTRTDPDKQERGIKALQKILEKELTISETQNNTSLKEEQRTSLEAWIRYVLLEFNECDTETRYIILRSVLRLKPYDPNTKSFKKRSRNTTLPFPEINKSSLEIVANGMHNHFTGINVSNFGLEDIEFEQFKLLLQRGNFAALYAFIPNIFLPKRERLLENLNGEWCHFPQGSSEKKLLEAIRGKFTGWCIERSSHAKKYLKKNDLYIYFSEDASGAKSIPRITVVKEGKEIKEIRGIGPHENIDTHAIPIIKEILKSDAPKIDKFKRKFIHHEKLKRLQNQKHLTLDEVEFLYELSEPIDYFGIMPPPLIEEIQKGRDKYQDFENAFGLNTGEVAFSQSEITESTTVFYGNYDANKATDKKHFPRKIYGDAILTKTEIDLISESPEDFIIYGSATIQGIDILTEQTILPTIERSINLPNTTHATSFVFQSEIKGNFTMDNLQSAQGITFPSTKNCFSLESLETPEGLVLPDVEGIVLLNRLKNTKDLVLKSNCHSLALNDLHNGIDLTIPEEFKGTLYLNGLITGRNLKIPKSFAGTICLDGLEHAKGLEIPNDFLGSIDLNKISDTKTLTLPQKMKGTLSLRGVSILNELRLPNEMHGDIYLTGLSFLSSPLSRESLRMPKAFTGNLYIPNTIPPLMLSVFEKEYPQYKDQIILE